MGSDYAGIVEKIGANVNHLKLGDEVISIHIGHTEGDELRDNCHFIKTFNVHKECVCLKPKNVFFCRGKLYSNGILNGIYWTH